MGTLQATEVLKEILGVGESLAGKLLIWDALATRFRTVRLRPDPNCALCGPAGDDQGPVAAPRRAGAGLCRLNRSASCCCPARMTGRTTRSCSPRAPRHSGGRSCCSPPMPAATRCSPTGPDCPTWPRRTGAGRGRRWPGRAARGVPRDGGADDRLRGGTAREGARSGAAVPGVEVAGVARSWRLPAADKSSADRVWQTISSDQCPTASGDHHVPTGVSKILHRSREVHEGHEERIQCASREARSCLLRGLRGPPGSSCQLGTVATARATGRAA